MASLIPNAFSSYSLTEEETLQGSILTITQQQVIQNRLAVVAEERLHLTYDVANPTAFLQAEAYKKGELDALRYILDVSDALTQPPVDFSEAY